MDLRKTPGLAVSYTVYIMVLKVFSQIHTRASLYYKSFIYLFIFFLIPRKETKTAAIIHEQPVGQN